MSEDIAFDYLIPEGKDNISDRLDIDFIESGGYCDLRIKGYSPDPAIIKLNKKDTEVIAASVQQDPLCLIDNWSLDLDYDGSLHKNRVSFVRNKNGIETHYNGKFSGCISIIVRDIFGGETQAILKSEQ